MIMITNKIIYQSELYFKYFRIFTFAKMIPLMPNEPVNIIKHIMKEKYGRKTEKNSSYNKNIIHNIKIVIIVSVL